MKPILILAALMISPTVVRAATPPAALSALDQAHVVLRTIIQSLPYWEADSLGRYERAEIAAVRFDIKACEMAATPDDFFIDYEKFKGDLGALLVLDASLDNGTVIPL